MDADHPRNLESFARCFTKVARLVETGRVRTTAQIAMGRIDAANLTRAHALVESGKTFGKVVLEGF